LPGAAFQVIRTWRLFLQWCNPWAVRNTSEIFCLRRSGKIKMQANALKGNHEKSELAFATPRWLLL
jgi:hypothetical protein